MRNKTRRINYLILRLVSLSSTSCCRIDYLFTKCWLLAYAFPGINSMDHACIFMKFKIGTLAAVMMDAERIHLVKAFFNNLPNGSTDRKNRVFKKKKFYRRRSIFCRETNKNIFLTFLRSPIKFSLKTNKLPARRPSFLFYFLLPPHIKLLD